MYQIKQLNSDFIVKEIFDLELDKTGTYQYFLLEKNGLNTLDAIFLLSETLKLPRKLFGYAGNKDKNAITGQVISIMTNIKINDFSTEKLKINFLGKGKERVNLGSHNGNKFTIVVRNLDNSTEDVQDVTFIPNYFDEQRFSSSNIEIGLKILKRDFQGAVELIIENSNDYDNTKMKMEQILLKNPKDFIGALRVMDKKILSIYLNSIQGLIFNEILTEYIEANCSAFKSVNYSRGEMHFPTDKPSEIMIPLVGFGLDIEDEWLIDTVNNKLSNYNLTTRSFIVKEIPEISSEGRLRFAFVDLADIHVSGFEDDELNSEKKKCKIEFSLPNGSYATVAIKSIFG